MNRMFLVAGIASIAMSLPVSAVAQKAAGGSVLEHSGEVGDLIVSRDGLVYHLSVGDELYENDILRAQFAKIATVSYNGCEFTLPEKQDVTLDSEFCNLVVATAPTSAEVASQSTTLAASNVGAGSLMNAPLMIGGTVLSAGGIAAAVNGGDGGTESAASSAAGAAPAQSSSD